MEQNTHCHASHGPCLKSHHPWTTFSLMSSSCPLPFLSPFSISHVYLPFCFNFCFWKSQPQASRILTWEEEQFNFQLISYTEDLACIIPKDFQILSFSLFSVSSRKISTQSKVHSLLPSRSITVFMCYGGSVLLFADMPTIHWLHVP